MPPKRKTKLGNKGDFFQYENQIELTFDKRRAQNQTSSTLKLGDDSSSSEDECIPFSKAKLDTQKLDTSSEDDGIEVDSSQGCLDSQEQEGKNIVLVDRPITPPPEIPALRMRNFSQQNSSLSRDLTMKLKSLQEVTQSDQSPVSLTGQWSDVVFVDQTSSPSLEDMKITIRIRTRNGVERFSIRMRDKFEAIIHELATKQGVSVESISLSFTDELNNLHTLKASDSPMSVNLSRTDIIDCVIVSSTSSRAALDEDDENVVNIKIQGYQADSVKLFKALKNEPLGTTMQQYADFRGVPLSRITFMFDGETFHSHQTPDDLEMDEDNVVDVRVS